MKDLQLHAGSFCRQNFKFEIFMPSFGRLCQRNVQKCGQHVQHDYFSVFTNSNIDFSGCRSLNPLLGRCFFKLVTAMNTRVRMCERRQ